MEWVSGILIWSGTQVASKIFNKMMENNNSQRQVLSELEKLQIQVRNLQNKDEKPPEIDLTVSKTEELNKAINTEYKEKKKKIVFTETESDFINIYIT